MGKTSTTLTREEILRKLYAMSRVRANDVVQLAFLSGEDSDQIRKLELSALRELKMGVSGGLEIKLIDRVRILEILLEHMEQTRENGLLRALESMAQGGGEELGDQ